MIINKEKLKIEIKFNPKIRILGLQLILGLKLIWISNLIFKFNKPPNKADFFLNKDIQWTFLQAFLIFHYIPYLHHDQF